jgi:hypothetical protein
MASHREVAHAWAHQTGRQRRGHHMFYEGRSIYSYGYHFEIARMVEAPSGRAVVLITADRYSVSTSQHTSIVRGAVSHMTSFVVEDVTAASPEDAAKAASAALEALPTLQRLRG